MNMPAAPSLIRPHRRICGLFFGAAIAAVFLARPLAIFPLGFIDMPHDLEVPVEALLALLAVPVLISGRWRPPAILLIMAGVFLFSLAVNWLRFGSGLEPSARLAGMMVVPPAFALALAVDGRRRQLERALTLLWCLQIGLSLWSVGFGQEVIGTAGNRNWAAALLLALVPWPWLATAGIAGPGLRRCLQLAIVLLTLVVLWRCQSRATWLAVFVCLSAWLLAGLRWRWRLLALAAFAILAMAAFLARPLWVANRVREDVRLPITARTVAMMAENDLPMWAVSSLLGKGAANADVAALRAPGPEGILGVGPGNFRRTFAPYRATSTYGERAVAAASTIHPHNEFLHIAAQIGILAGLAWLLFVFGPLPGALAERSDRGRQAAALGTLALFVCGCFDMPLFERPASLLFLLLLGASWPRRWLSPDQEQSLPGQSDAIVRFRLACTSLTLLAALFIGCRLGARELRVSQHARQAYIQENFRNNPAAAYDHFVAAANLADDPTVWWLFAGAISSSKLDAPERAVELLQAAAARDPNFGHINRELGKALMTIGRHAEAMPYLDRERRLYPHDPEGWHRQYTGSFFVGAFGACPTLAYRTQQLWQQRLQPDAGLHEKLAHNRQQWLDAMTAKDFATARSTAQELIAAVRQGTADPLFFVLAGEQSERFRQRFSGEFDDDDVATWQRDLAIAHLAVGLADNSPAGLMQILKGRMAIDSQAATSTIVDAIAAGRCSAALAAQVAWRLALSRGLNAYLTEWQGNPAVLILLADNGVILSPADSWQLLPAPPRHPAHLAYVLPDYFLRNQILRGGLQPLGTSLPPLPAANMVMLFNWLGEAPAGAGLTQFCELPIELLPPAKETP